MTSTAAAWFYHKPESIPYYIEERVNQTLWAARLGDIYLRCLSAEPPIVMEGQWHGSKIVFEWEPGRYFACRSQPAQPELVEVLNFVLGLKPSFSYEDADGMLVYEWRLEGDAERWQAIQGQPMYHHPRRLKDN